MQYSEEINCLWKILCIVFKTEPYFENSTYRSLVDRQAKIARKISTAPINLINKSNADKKINNNNNNKPNQINIDSSIELFPSKTRKRYEAIAIGKHIILIYYYIYVIFDELVIWKDIYWDFNSISFKYEKGTDLFLGGWGSTDIMIFFVPARKVYICIYTFLCRHIWSTHPSTRTLIHKIPKSDNNRPFEHSCAAIVNLYVAQRTNMNHTYILEKSVLHAKIFS